MSIFIDLLWSRRQLTIHFGYGSRGRRVQIRDCLHRLYRAKRLAGCDLGAGLRQIDENDVAQRSLCVIGNADSRGLAIGLDPFVFFGVFEVCWIRHAWLLASS